MSDILHNIANMLDKHESNAPENTAKTADNFQHDVDTGAEKAGADDVEVGKFMPPLQTKIELLKKTAGLESEFDDKDELGQIKQLSGINPVVLHVASEDNDVLG